MLSKVSLSARVSLMVVGSLAILTLLFGIAGSLLLRGEGVERAAARQMTNMGVAWQVLTTYGKEFRVESDSLYAGAQKLNGFFEPVDRVTELVGGTATVFMGDTRIATNVKKPDGSRAVGTKLAPGPVHDALFVAGQPFRGEADILGTPFYTAYDPIKDAAGKTIGVLYVGIPKAEFVSGITALQWRLGLISVVAALVIGLVALWLARRMFAPLKSLAETVAAVADGRTDVVVVGQQRGDEIGRMAGSVEHLRHAVLDQKRLKAEAAATVAAQEAERIEQEALGEGYVKAHAFFMSEVETGFQRLAAGDLLARLDKPFSSDYEPMRGLFNDSVGKLEEAMGSVVHSITAIRTGLTEITVASNDLAQRTEQQAASLEETVAALSEVTTGVNQTADGAARAQVGATAAQKNAEKGGEIVAKAVAAMSQIEHSSEEIGKIIGVIDEIAFQTNLLALNAGVEAARAGEAGRGFAVVAQEVRGLAQRSAEAAKEIKALISTSSKQVGEGVELVTASGKSLDAIVTQVAEMSAVVAEIARSAKEQAISLREVSGAADQMDKVTQQNAAMVEETTAAAQNLSDETEDLAGLIGRFQTRATLSSGMRPTRASPPRPAQPVAQLRNNGRDGVAPQSRLSEESWAEF
ncbi:hypothetical protein Sa4125_00090 [Aureimonas sp. SA4125]|uniref:methyl-accepting chemotaxis protein n=1 Tax=Aureimonas sp. SA4125 TaxID=2826993 RepID=UPI001CC762BB|nr:methyl-accepting chemotaxis protein [Aureimonas sp. SA4125]BDA82467.1 hypothetical protein Sa4125_00090 [Aureimonas sp. SA4125]